MQKATNMMFEPNKAYFVKLGIMLLIYIVVCSIIFPNYIWVSICTLIFLVGGFIMYWNDWFSIHFNQDGISIPKKKINFAYNELASIKKLSRHTHTKYMLELKNHNLIELNFRAFGSQRASQIINLLANKAHL